MAKEQSAMCQCRETNS